MTEANATSLSIEQFASIQAALQDGFEEPVRCSRSRASMSPSGKLAEQRHWLRWHPTKQIAFRHASVGGITNPISRGSPDDQASCEARRWG